MFWHPGFPFLRAMTLRMVYFVPNLQRLLFPAEKPLLLLWRRDIGFMKAPSERCSGDGGAPAGPRDTAVPPVPRGYPKRQERPESEPEYEILHYRRQQCFETDSQVWDAELRYRIDLAVKNPATGHYVLAIEYDGQAYHTKPADRDNDIYRQERLEERGWKFFRMDIAWYQDPAESRRTLIEAVKHAIQGDSLRYGISRDRPETTIPNITVNYFTGAPGRGETPPWMKTICKATTMTRETRTPPEAIPLLRKLATLK